MALARMFEKSVKDIMIPRADMTALSVKSSFPDLVTMFLKNGFYAMPVYRETVDNIVGVVTIHMILSLRESLKKEGDWQRYMSPPSFAPTSMTLGEALQKLRTRKNSMVFIVDEYGGIEGVVTRGMILKEISFMQNPKIDDEDTMVISRDPEIIISGKMDISDFEDEFSALRVAPEDREKINTIGGLICFVLGRVPLKGEIVKHQSGCIFEVREADSRRVHQVAVIKLPKSKK